MSEIRDIVPAPRQKFDYRWYQRRIHPQIHRLPISTTYSACDEMAITSLVIYLNSALPPDKYENFDTIEVARAATTLSKTDLYVVEGDILGPHNPSQCSR